MARTPAPVRVSHSIEVNAPIEVVFEAISDPRQYSRWSPESNGAHLPHVPPLHVGDSFTGANQLWIPWTGDCTVVAVDPLKRFSFDVKVLHVTVSRWTYETTATDSGGTVVTETWDDLRGSGFSGRAIRPAGIFVGRGINAAARNSVTMQETLKKLAADLGSHT